MTMTIYEASNCVQRCRYTYRWPCLIEYNPDYYSRDQIKCVWQRLQCRLQCRSQCQIQYRIQCRICYEVILPTILSGMRSRLRLGDPELLNYNDNGRLQIDFGNNTKSSPCNRHSLRSCMRLIAGGAMTFKKTGMTVPESQPTPTVNNSRPGSAGTKQREICSPIE